MLSDDSSISLFLNAADAVIADGVAHSRLDDPHRLAQLRHEFDDGRAVPRLVVDYLANRQVRITQLMFGTWQGEPKSVQVFSVLAQGHGSAEAH